MGHAGLNGIGARTGQLGDHIRGVVDDIGVIARPTDQRIGTRAAVEGIGGGVAGEGVSQVVTGAVERAGAGEGQPLHIGGQGMGHAGLDGIGARAGQLGDHVRHVVDDIGVIARPTDQRIGTRAAVEGIGGGVAGEGVSQVVTGAVDCTGAGQGQPLHVGSEGMSHARLDAVGAFTDQFRDHIRRVVDDIGVVTRPTDQRIGTRAAIKGVGRRVAGEGVDQVVTGAVDGAAAGEGQTFQVRGQGVSHARLNGVGAFTDQFSDHIRHVVDDIGLVAHPTDERIGAGVAIQGVVAGPAGEGVGRRVPDEDIGQVVAGAVERAGAGQGQPLHVGSEGMSHTGLDAVGAFTDQFCHHISRIVDDIGVVTRPTDQRIGTRAAIKDVGRRVAGEGVSQVVTGAVERAGAGQGQPLQVRGQSVGHARLNGVGALAGQLGDDVRGIVDDIGVVARATDEGIGARTAVEGISRRIAGERIDQVIAGAIDGAGTGQGQPLQVRGQDVGHARLDDVRALIRLLGDQVRRVVDDIGVVARPADQRVDAGTPVEGVGSGVAGEGIGNLVAGTVNSASTGENELFEVSSEAVSRARLNRVNALPE